MKPHDTFAISSAPCSPGIVEREAHIAMDAIWAIGEWYVAIEVEHRSLSQCHE